MHALIVLCHPERKSFNGALADLSKHTLEQRGYCVEIADLYGEEFDPREGPANYIKRENTDTFSALGEQRHAFKNDALPDDIKHHIARLQQADLVILQFPIWWHSHPAILKGWFDRVFVSGGLYTSSMRYDRGVFKGKKAICSVTIGAPDVALGPGCRGGDIEQILWSTHYSLHYLGFDVLPPIVATSVQGHGYATDDAATNKLRLERHKQGLRQRLCVIDRTCPMVFPGWSDWDENGVVRAI